MSLHATSCVRRQFVVVEHLSDQITEVEPVGRRELGCGIDVPAAADLLEGVVRDEGPGDGLVADGVGKSRNACTGARCGGQ